MRNIVIATIAAFLFGTAALAQPAEARCFWNGFAMECWHHPHHDWWARHHYWGPAPYRHYEPY
jgi:hypothetical protein